jgi:hypothetical protein
MTKLPAYSPNRDAPIPEYDQTDQRVKIRSDNRPDHTRRSPLVTSTFAAFAGRRRRFLVRERETALVPQGTVTYNPIVARWLDQFMCTARIPVYRQRTTSLARALATMGALLLATTVAQFSANARVLSDADMDKISSVRKLSIDVMTDITMLSRRPDLSQADSDCVKSTLRSLTQIAGELQSYEYLITIESELKNFDDDNSLRGVLRFAVENALKILETERKHLVEISDQCARSPLSAEKARQATQFIESTQSVLKSLQPRL